MERFIIENLGLIKALGAAVLTAVIGGILIWLITKKPWEGKKVTKKGSGILLIMLMVILIAVDVYMVIRINGIEEDYDYLSSEVYDLRRKIDSMPDYEYQFMLIEDSINEIREELGMRSVWI